MTISKSDAVSDDALQGLRRGDFSRLDFLFQSENGSRPKSSSGPSRDGLVGTTKNSLKRSRVPASMAESELLNTCWVGELRPQAVRVPDWMPFIGRSIEASSKPYVC